MPITPENEAVIDTALTAAAVEDGATDADAKAKQEEKAQVKVWLERIKEARDFDKQVWESMAIARGYAAGVSAHLVSVNLIGSAIDVMKSFLYARNPDVAVVPARRTSLPNLQRPIMPIPPENPMAQVSALTQQVAGPETPGASLLTDPMVMAQLAPIVQQYQAQLAVYQQEQAAYAMAMQAYIGEMQRRKEERSTRKRFSETMEILLSKAWSLADLKGEARVAVGATLTTKIGWMKQAWHEDNGLDPVSTKKLASLQENIAQIDMLRAKMADGQSTENLDALRQQITEAIAGLNAATEVVTSRGMVIDSIPGEDMTVPIGVTRVAAACGDSPWLSQRIFMHIELAKTTFKDVPEEKWKSACRYSQVKPVMVVRVPEGDAPGLGVSERSDAGQFTQGGPGSSSTEMKAGADGDFVCIHELWDKTENMIRTLCEGMSCYVRVPHAPEIATTRFYPFYNMAFVEADGLRYPQSLVERSYGLQDEYNARRSSLQKQRSRAKQGILVDGGALDKDEAGKLKMSVEGELIVIDTTGDRKSIQNVFMEKPTVRLDPALYEVDSIRRDFEEMWGIQQALQGGVKVEQTATESQIQDQGFQSRTNFMREPLEALLNDMAVAGAEILLQRLTLADAQEFCGEGAVWPEAATVADLASLVNVQIKAGSTGKPNTAAERNAWAQTMPLLSTGIKEIAALRQSPPEETADSLEKLIAITLELAGSSISVEDIVPQESMPTLDAAAGMAPPESAPAADVPAGRMDGTGFAEGPPGPGPAPTP